MWREALALTDRLLELNYHHAWEQLAVSVTLARRGRIETFNKAVHHYWDQREEYTEAIGGLLHTIREPQMSAEAAIDHARENAVVLPPYQAPCLATRIWRRIVGRSKMVSIRMQEDVTRFLEPRGSSQGG